MGSRYTIKIQWMDDESYYETNILDFKKNRTSVIETDNYNFEHGTLLITGRDKELVHEIYYPLSNIRKLVITRAVTSFPKDLENAKQI